MNKINTYLNFDGHAEAAFRFYQSIFGGEFPGGIRRMKDMPGGEKLGPEEQDRVIHIALPIGNDLLMGADILPSMGHQLTQGNHSYISVFPDSQQEADRLFNGLSEGGSIELPIKEQFWGDYFGSFTDRFGVRWMINFVKSRVS
ncbi:VOC family protein [Niabella terrae]